VACPRRARWPASVVPGKTGEVCCLGSVQAASCGSSTVVGRFPALPGCPATLALLLHLGSLFWLLRTLCYDDVFGGDSRQRKGVKWRPFYGSGDSGNQQSMPAGRKMLVTDSASQTQFRLWKSIGRDHARRARITHACMFRDALFTSPLDFYTSTDVYKYSITHQVPDEPSRRKESVRLHPQVSRTLASHQYNQPNFFTRSSH
jgi:hypothetical protein